MGENPIVVSVSHAPRIECCRLRIRTLSVVVVCLKHTQKGIEEEWTVGDPAAINGSSSEILYLLDPAQGLCIPEGNIVCSVQGKLQKKPRSRRPVRVTHSVKQATSEALSFLYDSRLPTAIVRVG